MKYIWINPVAAAMYDKDELTAFLKKHELIPVEASTHWLETVRKKYKSAIMASEKPVLDMRCPKSIEFADAYALRDKVTIPDIEPILIHCGQEINQRSDLQGVEKIITTPCQALADFGNSLRLPDTTFLPWNQLLRSLGGGLTAAPPKESPIPPGFFDGLDCRKISVTGKEDICDFFEGFKPDNFDMIELLYCRDGCHNGDGVCHSPFLFSD